MLNDSSLTAFDFFAGGGGASLGLHRAGINMLAALNHSPVAIATHEANFPGARHMLCDIRVQKSWGLGHADIMWASPDCTHHSIAKGGQSRDAKERALAEELPRFAYNLNVNCIMVENVKEFIQWGRTMEKNGKMVPDPKYKGEYYRQWVSTLAALGFVNYEYRLINSADFGVPQSRVRYFGIFTRRGVAINWPEPTHDRNGKNSLPKWTAVRTVLDLEDKGRSIFTQWDKGPGRKAGDKPADKTLRRILAGLQKHVIGNGGTEFLDKRTSNPPSGKPGTGASTKEPGPTMATCYLPDLITPVRFLFDPYAWHGATRSVERESPTIVASQDKAPLGLVSAFMAHAYSGRGQSSALCSPHPACLTNPHGSLITPVFLTQYNGGSDNCRVLSLGGAVNTVPTENRFAQISAAFLCGQYGQHHNTTLCRPCPPLLTIPKQNLVTFMLHNYGGVERHRALCNPAAAITCTGGQQYAVQCLMQANGTRANDTAARLTTPLIGQAPTINTNGGNLYLMSYYGNGELRPVCNPCFTLRTHDCAALLGFVTGSGYEQRPYPFTGPASPILASRRHQYQILAALGSPVADVAGDSEAMRELKEVCRQNGIADIYMRMLKVSELKLIMGFPADYYLSGSATKQKEMLGNAVVPQVSEAIARAMMPGLVAARLRKLPKLRVAAINRYEQAQVFRKEVACA